MRVIDSQVYYQFGDGCHTELVGAPLAQDCRAIRTRRNGRHVAPGVALRPVVAVDEAGLYSVRLELLQHHPVAGAAVDAHPDTETSPLDAILDRRVCRLEGQFQVLESGGLVRFRRVVNTGGSSYVMGLGVFSVGILLAFIYGAVYAVRSGLYDIRLVLDAGEVDTGKLAHVQGIAHKLAHGIRELHNLRRRVELADHLADYANALDGIQV